MNKIFKIMTSISLFFLALYTGFTHKKLWSLGIVSLLFTAAYIQSKFNLWADVYKNREISVTLYNFLKTYASQLFLVSILYFIAYGLSSALFNKSGFVDELQDIYFFFTAIVFFLVVISLVEYFGGKKNLSKFDELILEAGLLGEQEMVMPVNIFRIAHELSELDDKEEVAYNVKEILLKSKSMHTRRVGFNVYRNMGIGNLKSIDMEEILIDGLDDPHPWVQYDALRVIEKIGISNDKIFNKLKFFVAGEKKSDDKNDYNSSSDAEKKIVELSKNLLEKFKDT